MPAASYVVARGYKPGVTDQVYESRAAVLAAAASIIRSEVVTLVEEGCPYVQLDNPHYPDYVPDERREQWASLGVDQDRALQEDIDADNSCLRGFDRSSTILAMHLCRGNGVYGAWHTSGGYDRIAEQLFSQLEVDTFLLEYDSERAGTFAPLRFMPKGKTVVLGLVTTKGGRAGIPGYAAPADRRGIAIRGHGQPRAEPPVRLLFDAAGQPPHLGRPAAEAGAGGGDGAPGMGNLSLKELE